MKIKEFTNDELINFALFFNSDKLTPELCKRLIDLESRADYYKHFCEEAERDVRRLKMQLDEA
tara:strand:+ start:35510 stop:35698 length:189 start_codon:yes stop_codon:yes gene_type:complete